MTHNEHIRQAAAFLAEVRLSGKAADGLPAACAPADLPAAYAVQTALNEQLARQGLDRVTGYKIGCTTKVMQEYLEIPHPCAGAMFGATVSEGKATWQRAALVRPGVECEIAVDLARDITTLDGDGPEAVAPFVAAARASIELVDDRWTDFRLVATPSLIAENFFNAGCVVGPAVEMDPMRLDTLKGGITVNGKAVGAGSGADIMGHPLNGLVWLAKHQIAQGQPLRSGQTITLGSLVETVWLEPGSTVEVEIEALGRCSLTLGD